LPKVHLRITFVVMYFLEPFSSMSYFDSFSLYLNKHGSHTFPFVYAIMLILCGYITILVHITTEISICLTTVIA
jgi:uncharacterized membrane protein